LVKDGNAETLLSTVGRNAAMTANDRFNGLSKRSAIIIGATVILVLAAARIRVNTATDPLLLPIVCQLALVGRKDSSQPPTSTAECGWVADPNQRWPSAANGVDRGLPPSI